MVAEADPVVRPAQRLLFCLWPASDEAGKEYPCSLSSLPSSQRGLKSVHKVEEFFWETFCFLFLSKKKTNLF